MPPEDEVDEVAPEVVTETPPVGHPAWQEILNVLPEEFHTLITPKLQEWDTGVQANQQKLHTQYEVYKPLLDNGVPLETIEQALYMAQMLENEPETLVEKAIEHYKLEKYMKTDVSNNGNNSNDYDDDDDDDTGSNSNITVENLKKNPAFKQFFEQQEELVKWQQSQQSDKEQQEASSYMEKYLTGLHTEHGDFDDLVITALMANGFDGKDAVEQFQTSVNQAAAKLSPGKAAIVPPVVIGSGGTTGSGIPDNTIDLGTMGKSDLNDLVLQYINSANAS